jgi:hypothetical protein
MIKIFKKIRQQEEDFHHNVGIYHNEMGILELKTEIINE